MWLIICSAGKALVQLGGKTSMHSYWLFSRSFRDLLIVNFLSSWDLKFLISGGEARSQRLLHTSSLLQLTGTCVAWSNPGKKSREESVPSQWRKWGGGSFSRENHHFSLQYLLDTQWVRPWSEFFECVNSQQVYRGWFVVVYSPSHVQLFATPWAAACQAPLSSGFPRQESWSGSG